MLRQIVLDTETTGLHPERGHRIIELGAVELIDRQPTGRTLQLYVNPEREIEADATKVHGKTLEDLQDKPTFADVAADFLDFVWGAEWIAHNAPFDIAFVDHELRLAGLPGYDRYCTKVIDTIELARDKNPGKRKSLDALCDLYRIDRTRRTLHGALLDAELLSQVYLAVTTGQETLGLLEPVRLAMQVNERVKLIVIEPTADELAEHAAILAAVQKESKGHCVWLQ